MVPLESLKFSAQQPINKSSLLHHDAEDNVLAIGKSKRMDTSDRIAAAIHWS
jgi:hypothetical protein